MHYHKITHYFTAQKYFSFVTLKCDKMLKGWILYLDVGIFEEFEHEKSQTSVGEGFDDKAQERKV